MTRLRRRSPPATLIISLLFFVQAFEAVAFQESATVLTRAELTRVVPSGFYFEGQSAPTQMRNSAAVRFGPRRQVIAGLVDTSGYSADVRAKYEGFLITDSAIQIGGSELAVGAYGFGFTDDAKFNVFDISGSQILSVSATHDRSMRRPRPLVMVKAVDGVRLYNGRHYVRINPR